MLSTTHKTLVMMVVMIFVLIKHSQSVCISRLTIDELNNQLLDG